MSAAALPWHRRPVRLRDLVAVLGATALVWLALALALLSALRERLYDPASDPWQAAVRLQELPLSFTLPEGLRAEARLQQHVAARLLARPRLAAPIDQLLSVRVGGPGAALPARARIDTMVNVDTRFRVQQHIDVDTELDAQVRLVSWLAPFAVRVPVRLQVPVDVHVPVRARVPVHIDAPVQARLDAPLAVPLRTTLQVRPQLSALLNVQVVGHTGFRVLPPALRVDAMLQRADLRIGRGDVRIGLRGKAASAPQPASTAR